MAANESEEWDGMESSVQDDEEVRVIFCALDSFL